jgi:hypothetical protein
MEEIINNFLEFILNPVLPDWLLFVKFVFLLISLFFIGFIFFALITTSYLKRLIIWDMIEYLTYRHYGAVNKEKKWVKIKERLGIGTEPEAKLALIEAGTLLDNSLRDMGYAGANLTERIDRLTTDIIENLSDLKDAHEVRSNIIHDPTYRLDVKEARELLDVYEKALVDLQIL